MFYWCPAVETPWVVVSKLAPFQAGTQEPGRSADLDLHTIYTWVSRAEMHVLTGLPTEQMKKNHWLIVLAKIHIPRPVLLLINKNSWMVRVGGLGRETQIKYVIAERMDKKMDGWKEE